ncbi:MAG: hypothetical protein R3C61_25830 [Bacteroidia bacterium]
MQGIELIKDRKGNITEIRVDVKGNPDLAADIYHLVGAIKRVAETEKSNVSDAKRSYPSKGPMTREAFHALIREAKASGEISASVFFQQNPQWRQKEKLS